MRTLLPRRARTAALLAGCLGIATLVDCVFTIAPLADSPPDATTHADGTVDAKAEAGVEARDAHDAPNVDGGRDATDGSVSDATTHDAAAHDSSDGACDEASLTADPANCGACNHGCLEGGCLGGQCLPVTIFTMLGSNLSGLYVADGVVFCTFDLSSSKGAAVEVAPSNDPLQTGLAYPAMITGTGTTSLFWSVSGTGVSDAGEAGIGSLQNGTTRFLSLKGSDVRPRAIVVLDGGDIAFGNATADGSVMRTSGSITVAPKIVTTLGGNYLGLATDGTRLWTTSMTDNTLYRLDPADGGAHMTQHVVYANPDAGPGYVAYYGGKVFLSNYAGNYLGVVDQPTLDNQPLRLLATADTKYAPSPLEPDAGRAITTVFAIAADDRYVYWTDKGADSVGRIAYADGGPAEVFAYLAHTGPNQLYITDAAVYFNAVQTGGIYRVAK